MTLVLKVKTKKGKENILQRHSSRRTDMINCTSTEFSIELLGTKAPEVLDGEWPEMKHIVPWEGISLLKQHHFGPQESQFDGCTQAAWSSTNDQTLSTGRHRCYSQATRAAISAKHKEKHVRNQCILKTHLLLTTKRYIVLVSHASLLWEKYLWWSSLTCWTILGRLQSGLDDWRSLLGYQQ